MIIKIKSDNPQFSRVIGRNPDGLPFVQTIRSGFGVGLFMTPQEYVLRFIPNDPEDFSAPFGVGDQGAYSDPGKYLDPVVGLCLIKELLSSTTNKLSEKDQEGFRNELTISWHWSNAIIFRAFASHFKDVEFKCEQSKVDNLQRITLTTSKSVQYLLNLIKLYLFCLVTSSTYGIPTGPDFFEQFFKSVDVVNAPYFIRYLVKKYMLKNQVSPKIWLERLSIPGQINMVLEDTQKAREKFVKEAISSKEGITTVIDFGCGECQHAKRLASNYRVIAYDLPEVIADNRSNPKLTKIDNLVLTDSLDEVFNLVKDLSRSEIAGVLSEVIEHIDPKTQFESLKFLGRICSLVVVTTPNKDFNQFYDFDDDQVRRDDHLTEYVRTQFNYILETYLPYGHCVSMPETLGDSVLDGDKFISPTLGAVCIYS